MEYQSLFTPLKIADCTIPNRFAVTAMVTNMCTEDGYATEQYIKYHEAKAKGGFGLIITEDYGINPNAKGYKYVAGLFDDAQIEGHRKLTDAVHQHGAKIFCQIYHAGRQSNSLVNGGMQPVACSPMSCPWNREMARELSVEEIQELVRQFGSTAARVKQAGFDGVEIHAGNGYLIAGFMSFYENKRTDEYGGCFNNRMRLLREVYDAVRGAVGPDFPVSVRYSADEHTLSGRGIAESRMVARLLEEWGVDLINCSNGVYGTYNPGQVAPSYQPHAWTIDNAAALKKVVKIPVLGVNSIDDPLMAESLLESGFCDIVGMSRCSLADPEMPNKAKEGRFEEIRPCIRCMQGCVSGTYLQVPIRCCVNPELNREYEYTYENKPSPKKVLIVGGGVAGMEAAIAASRMGHKVTLWEAGDKLGGQFVAAAYPPGKGDFITFTCYLISQIKKLGVTVELNKKATAENVRAFGGDKMILATGGLPNKPRIPGIDRPNVVFAEDILLGKAQAEGRIIVAGGGEVGVETAMYLADAERGQITVIEMADKLSAKADGTKVVAMVRFMKERDVRTMMNTKVLEICESGVLVEQEGQKTLLPCDAIVVSMGYHPNNGLKDELSFLGDKLVIAGDAEACTNAMEAGTAGFRAGYYA
ncbi:2,4-dienoyl-CoA reductase [Sporobacter termitidis DSM 10068]|uniref:2,4-dienoyl-CoA reductase n=1 Tax=Sporobacter termitidis DSM 10068 TaxID=1123282 RepID=A0A1M5XVR6_9FIRM|nr:FAD-dependent oxidoreductase [Sporobacter termitidis]SHI03618.1 2,4-dienoyl-CoA reductase [Sporobacter termitidis DSM 10068]